MMVVQWAAMMREDYNWRAGGYVEECVAATHVSRRDRVFVFKGDPKVQFDQLTMLLMDRYNTWKVCHRSLRSIVNASG